MVKPQFEVGREEVGKGGVVRDPALRREALVAVGAAGTRARRGGARLRVVGAARVRRAIVRRSCGWPKAAGTARWTIWKQRPGRSRNERAQGRDVVFTHRPPDRDERRAGAGGWSSAARAAVLHAALLRRRRRSNTASRAEPGSRSTPARGRRGRPLRRARRRRHEPPHALRTYARTRVPVFAVNYGEVGFLATVDPDRLEEGLRLALSPGDFEPMHLPVISLRGRTPSRWTAINDVSLPPQGGPARRGPGDASARDEIGRVRCDGLVVATPAGSTGYNLANGGPVMAWGVEGFVVSFIAPRSAHRPLARGRAHRHAERREPLHVTNRPTWTVDAGQIVCELKPGKVTSSWASPTTRRCWRSSRTRPSTTACARSSAAWRARRANCADSVRLCDKSAQERTFAPVPSAPAGRPLCVLHEPRVENLLLIERAELRLGPGLNVLTGETGAGKTMLAHALDLLLGGKPRSGIVRPGAAEA